MANPTPQQVAAFLGRGDDAQLLGLAEEHLPVVTEFVRAYTRGGGFATAAHLVLDEGAPLHDVEQVIVTSCARLMSNPSSARRESIGDYDVSFASLNGWTLPELAVLHRHRRRLA